MRCAADTFRMFGLFTAGTGAVLPFRRRRGATYAAGKVGCAFEGRACRLPSPAWEVGKLVVHRWRHAYIQMHAPLKGSVPLPTPRHRRR